MSGQWLCRLISRAWEIAGTRYEEPKLMNRSSSQLLSNEDGVSLEYYNCPTSGGNSSAHYYTGVVSAALTVWGYRVTRDSEFHLNLKFLTLIFNHLIGSMPISWINFFKTVNSAPVLISFFSFPFFL